LDALSKSHWLSHFDVSLGPHIVFDVELLPCMSKPVNRAKHPSIQSPYSPTLPPLYNLPHLSVTHTESRCSNSHSMRVFLYFLNLYLVFESLHVNIWIACICICFLVVFPVQNWLREDLVVGAGSEDWWFGYCVLPK